MRDFGPKKWLNDIFQNYYKMEALDTQELDQELKWKDDEKRLEQIEHGEKSKIENLMPKNGILVAKF